MERAWEELKFSCRIYKIGAFLRDTGLLIKETSHTPDTHAFKKLFCHKFCYKGNKNENFSSTVFEAFSLLGQYLDIFKNVQSEP